MFMLMGLVNFLVDTEERDLALLCPATGADTNVSTLTCFSHIALKCSPVKWDKPHSCCHSSFYVYDNVFFEGMSPSVRLM